MPIRANRTLAALREGRTALGGGAVFAHPSVPSVFAAAGLDFIWLDLEHTLTDPQQLGAQIHISRLAGITPIVRVPGFVPGLVRALLDNGAQGIILPFVEGPEEVAQLVATCAFHPAGRRGVASPLLANDFTPTTIVEHVGGSDAEILVAVQAESLAALERIDEIVAVDGLDLVIVGLNDLSISCGVPGEISHPRVAEATEAVIAAATRRGVAAGVAGFPGPTEGVSSIERWERLGARFFQLFGDLDLFAKAVRAEVTAAGARALR